MMERELRNRVQSGNQPLRRGRGLFLLALLALLFAPEGEGQTTYYVSAAGSDQNPGTSPGSPWATLARVASAPLGPGDAVLFRRGDTFRGELRVNASGTVAAPIRFGAYGPGGGAPVISGALPLTGWRARGGGTYVTRASGRVRNLFADGVQMTLARFPNEGFLTISTTNGSTSLTAAGMARAPGYWASGNLRVRTADFAFETRRIASSDAGGLTVAAPTTGALQAGWGFYLDNVPGELDAAAEWYSDPATDSVYFRPPGGVDPNTLQVEGASFPFGVLAVGRSHVHIDGLAFDKQDSIGICFAGSKTGIRVLSCAITNAKADGIFLAGTSTACEISGTAVTGANNRGIAVDALVGGSITDNVIRRIGLVHGYGYGISNQHAWMYDGATGIAVWSGSGGTIRGNTIDSVGYIGIYPRGNDMTISRNVIRQSMLKFNDGGAIYMMGPEGLPYVRATVTDNIIIGTTGNVEAMSLPRDHVAPGIYVDVEVNSSLFQNNTVADVAYGPALYFHVVCKQNTIRGNTVYNYGFARSGQVALQFVQDTTKSHGGYRIVGNRILARNNLGYIMQIMEPWFRGYTVIAPKQPGVLDSNYYCNPYGKPTPFQTLLFDGTWTYTSLSAAGWRGLWNQDAHSRGLYKVLTATDSSAIFINTGSVPRTEPLSGIWRNLDGALVPSPLVIPPYSSVLLIHEGSSSLNSRTLEVAPGWNLLSVPFRNPAPGDSVHQVFPRSLHPYAYFHAADAGYEPRYRLSTGPGYWVKFPDAAAVGLAGTTLDRDTIPVAPGWNFIGSLSDTVDTGLVETVPPGLLASEWFAYTAAGGYEPAARIVPGRGYCVQARGAGLVIRRTGGGAGSVAAGSPGLLEGLNMLRISDSRGSGQTLYFGPGAGGEGRPSEPLLPPPAPAGCLDARFDTEHGGTLVRLHPTASVGVLELPVAVRTDAFPLTLSWRVEGEGPAYRIHTGSAGAARTLTGSGSVTIADLPGGRLVLEVSGRELPERFALSQNYPNPFNPSTRFSYSLPVESDVTLRIFTILGQQVRTLEENAMPAGIRTVEWDGRGEDGLPVAAGVYLCRFEASPREAGRAPVTEVRKLLLLR